LFKGLTCFKGLVMPKILLIFLSLFFLQIQAMESPDNEADLVDVVIDDNKPDDRMLTLGELEDFLFDFYRRIFSTCVYKPETPCDGSSFWPTCGWTALISVPISLICGMGLAIFGCRPKNESCLHWTQDKCPPGVDIKDSSWMDEKSCVSGIVFFASTPFFPFLAASVITPVVWALDKYTARKNKLLRRDLHEKFTHGRPSASLATSDDIRSVAMLLMESKSPLLKKLNADQSLILAEEDFPLFETLQDQEFFPKAIWAHKISILFRASSDELEDLFGDERIGEFFNQEKRMWETVVRILPNDHLSPAIKIKLGAILAGLKIEIAAIEVDWAQVIDEVKAKKPIDDIIDKIVIDDENNKGELVILHTKRGDIKLNKKRLKEISKFFATSLSGNWRHTSEQNLLDVEENLIDVLVRFAKKEELDLRINIKDVVAAAAYFGMTELTKQCDALIVSEGVIYNGSSNNLLLKAMNRDKKNPPNIKAQWKFFKTNRLVLNQTRLAQVFMENLAITFDEDIKILGNYVNKAADSLDRNGFIKKLEDPENLSFAWRHFSKISLLRQIIVEFCAGNEVIREKAWVLIPADLDKEIKEVLARPDNED
jgi:hypothetical protein